jgi:hypothetical protein
LEHSRIGNFRVTVASVLPILGKRDRMRYYEAAMVIAADGVASGLKLHVGSGG